MITRAGYIAVGAIRKGMPIPPMASHGDTKGKGEEVVVVERNESSRNGTRISLSVSQIGMAAAGPQQTQVRADRFCSP